MVAPRQTLTRNKQPCSNINLQSPAGTVQIELEERQFPQERRCLTDETRDVYYKDWIRVVVPRVRDKETARNNQLIGYSVTGMIKEREKLRMTSKFLASNQKDKRIGKKNWWLTPIELS